MKLLKITKENIETKIKDPPFCPFPKRVLNSICKVERSLFHIRWYREGINQKGAGIRKIPIKALSQLIDNLITLDEGSKIENKFVIIFNL